MGESQKDMLETERIEKLLLKFAVPTTMTLLVNCLYNIVDQIFIGWAQGINGIAATNIAFPMGVIAAALALMVGDGSAANMSLCLGEGKTDEANRIFTNGVRFLIIIGISIAILGSIFVEQIAIVFGAPPEVLDASVAYLRILMIGIPFSMFCMSFTAMIRADGNPKYMMRTMMIGAGLNVVLDPIFIFVLEMGVVGAAIATIIGQIVSGVMALAYLPRFERVRMEKTTTLLESKYIKRIFSLGFPSFCTQGATAVTQITMNHMMSRYGAVSIYGSEIALSCYGIMMKIYQIAHAMFVGLASGTQPINGYNFGAKAYDRVRQTYKIAFIMSMVISVVWFGIFQLGGGVLARVFIKDDPLYLEFAVHAFHLYMLAFFLYGPPQITSSFFQAVGKPKQALLVSLARQVAFLIPLALVLSSRFGLDGALIAAPIADVLAFLLAIFLVYREFKHWKGKGQGQGQEKDRGFHPHP